MNKDKNNNNVKFYGYCRVGRKEQISNETKNLLFDKRMIANKLKQQIER